MEERQHFIEGVQEWLWIFVLLLLLLGLVLLVVGMRRMKAQQEWEDRQLRAQAKQAEASIEPESERERAERLAKEAAAVVREEQPAEPTATEVESGSTPTREPDAADRTRVRRAEIMRDAAEVERKVLKRVEQDKPAGYRFLRNAKVVSRRTGVSMFVDGLLECETGTQPDVLIEIKLTSAPRRAVRNYTDQMLAALSRYGALTGREAVGWLICVVDDRVQDQDVREAEDWLSHYLGPSGRVTVVRRRDIPKMRSFDE